jgi:hypothetical protein
MEGTAIGGTVDGDAQNVAVVESPSLSVMV